MAAHDMRKLWLLLAVPLLLGAYAALFLMVNSSATGAPRNVERAPVRGLPEAGESLDIVTWNIGYAGLGAGSDFVADGGAHYLPPSRQAALDNAAGIGAFLATQNDADLVLIEELAEAGPVNRWVNPRRRIDAALPDRERIFYADFRTRLMPFPLRLNHGQGIYSRRAIAGTDLVPLPAEAQRIFGVRRRYAATVARLAGPQHWTVASVHLAAFDDNAVVRTRQLRQLLAWASAEYKSGRHVVLGGDWNLQLADTYFPHTTEQRFLFWVFPFPQGALPAGWRIACDPSTPSVRTNERPYVAGQNYTTIIDGFIVSPNVAVDSVRGFDLGFAHSDHQPVRIRVRAQ
jgi:endonuclease/exonuclease/phosphatase family metal-dependent hydrolase